MQFCPHQNWIILDVQLCFQIICLSATTLKSFGHIKFFKVVLVCSLDTDNEHLIYTLSIKSASLIFNYGNKHWTDIDFSYFG
jgi:hypothetical protein